MDTVTLPGGGRQAVLRPLTGREEELLADGGGTPAHAVTRLLARCVRIGGAEVTEDAARELTVGDRQFLLLSLRQATFGPTVAAVATCPWPGCARRMDLDFAVPDIPVRVAAGGDAEHETVLSPEAADGGEEARRVRFRLPTGADQEALGGLAAAEPAAALDALLRRCVLSVGGRPVDGTLVLSPRAKAELEAALHAVAYGPLLSFDAVCPECGRGFTLPFDVQDFFFGEIRATPELLLREVHQLALHYHWSESDILGLTRERRRRYLGLLADELDRTGDALG